MLATTFYIVLTLLVLLTAGSLLSLSSSPHWFVRGWDFPRIQIIAIAWILVGILYAITYSMSGKEAYPIWICLVITIFLTGWHGYQIAPYTFLATKQAKGTDPKFMHNRSDESTVRVVISNVELENDHYREWLEVIRQADPDILIALEMDQAWIDEAQPLLKDFPHQVLIPQDNWYGMVMVSKLEMESHQVHYRIQDDIPSIDAKIRLRDGRLIRMIAVHPRPPEPIRDNNAVARDAELTLWGRELDDDDRPIIIGGDLNDVAWSSTTRLFLRMSGMLDPRRGRGFFNTFHAGHIYMRFPLDHVFHSPHFTVSNIRRLSHVGSDHFPMSIDLRFSPEDKAQHAVLDEEEDDDEKADLRLERALEDDSVDGEIKSSQPVRSS